MKAGQILFSFQGRIPRHDYWLKGFLILFPLQISNVIMLFLADEPAERVLALVIGIILLWPALALLVKRLHDRNRSGWCAATLLIPIANIIIGIWILVEVWFLRGTTGANRFGDDSVQEKKDTAIGSSDSTSLPFIQKRPVGVSVAGYALAVLSMFRLLIVFIPTINDNNHIFRYLSGSFMPVDFIIAAEHADWMRPVFNLRPFGFFGVIAFEYVSIIFTYYIGVCMLYGIWLARWLYLGFGAFGSLIIFTSSYLSPGYIVIHFLIYVSFLVILFLKNSSDFFSRSKGGLFISNMEAI